MKSWIIFVGLFLSAVAIANIVDKGHDKGWIDTKLRQWLSKTLELIDPVKERDIKFTFLMLIWQIVLFVFCGFFSWLLYYIYLDEDTLRGPWWLWPLYAIEAFPIFPFAPIGAILFAIGAVALVFISAHQTFILVSIIMLKAATKPSTSPFTYLVAVGGFVGVVAKTILDLAKAG